MVWDPEVSVVTEGRCIVLTFGGEVSLSRL